MPQKYFQKNTHKRTRMIIIAAILIVCLTILILALTGVLHSLFSPELAQPLDADFPGSSEALDNPFRFSEDAADPMFERVQQLLLHQNQYVAWYRQAGRTGTPPAERATIALASDQVLLGAYLLEQKDKDAFQTWWSAFKTQWQNSDDSYQGAHSLDPIVSVDARTDWLRINFSVARLLVQSCSVWPDSSRMEDLKNLSHRLLATLDEGVPIDQIAIVPTREPIVDPGATPTPKPSISPTPVPGSETTLPVIRLASLDLYTMSLLIQIDPQWSVWSDYYHDLIVEGYLGDEMPLYAWAWSPQQDGYLPFHGSTPQIDTQEAVLTILHLCEAGVYPESSINWIRNQLMNQNILYKTYHPVQGTAVDTAECITAYAVTARIARIIEDEYLYKTAVDRLLWHQATSQTSDVLHAIFRQEDKESVTVWAHDNFWALLALR